MKFLIGFAVGTAIGKPVVAAVNNHILPRIYDIIMISVDRLAERLPEYQNQENNK